LHVIAVRLLECADSLGEDLVEIFGKALETRRDLWVEVLVTLQILASDSR